MEDRPWLAAERWGKRYSAHRRAELAQVHGGAISAGVAVIIESAADFLVDARYWRARSIELRNPDLSRLAAQLTAQARGCERDAWELAAREATARKTAEGRIGESPIVAAIREAAEGLHR